MSSRWRVDYTTGVGRNAGARESRHFEQWCGAETFARAQVARGNHASITWLVRTEGGETATLLLTATRVEGRLELQPPQ